MVIAFRSPHRHSLPPEAVLGPVHFTLFLRHSCVPMLNNELQQTLTFILAGGQGERLMPLTKKRAKPAVPFGGAYRIIDFTLTNCIHSGLRRVFVLTQYQARSLEEHLRFAWNFLPRRLRQFISPRAPHHGLNGRWYAGTADALFHNLDVIREERPARVLILSGDHIYKMNYGEMLMEHIATEARLTIGAVKIPVEESRRFGILETDTTGRVLGFQEKPERGAELPEQPGFALGSMGIYLFETEELLHRLEEDSGAESSHDFGKDVIPRMIENVDVHAHMFRDVQGGDPPYWRDVGTIDAYFDANLDLCSAAPQFNLYDENWPIYTLWHNDPPSKTIYAGEDQKAASVTDSLLCPGVIVSGARAHRSVLSPRTFVGEGASVDESIIMRGVKIGAGAQIRRAIIDKWTEVPPGERIGYDLDRDRGRFKVTDSGIVVVPRRYQFD